jgi:hypothetical protein
VTFYPEADALRDADGSIASARHDPEEIQRLR